MMEEQVTIVTGGGRGIGLVIARTLARRGHAVAILDLDAEHGERAAAKLRDAGHDAVAHRTDIASEPSVDAAVAAVCSSLGTPTALVNNAGVYSQIPTAAESVGYGEWRRVIEVNVNGSFLVSQRVGRLMIERRAGAIVNIASIYGMRGPAIDIYGSVAGRRHDDAAYHVSKAALLHLTRTLASSWGPFGVRVNSVSPGPIDIDSSHEDISPDVLARLSKRVPAGRLGRPQEVADAVAYLLSERAAYVTGANLVVDGGWTCR